MRLKLPLRIITLVCAVSLLAYACGDSTSPVEGRPVSLTLIPSEFTLNAVGDTKDLGPSFPGGGRAIQKGWSTTISGVWRASRMSSACR